MIFIITLCPFLKQLFSYDIICVKRLPPILKTIKTLGLQEVTLTFEMVHLLIIIIINVTCQ